MTDPDDELMDELRVAMDEYDPVPDHLVQFAKAAFSLRTLDADLAELLEDEALAGVRSAATPELLTFVVGDHSIELDLAGDRVEGQLVPPGPADVVIERAGANDVTVTADDRGRFAFERPAGPVRLVTAIDGQSVVTDWFVA